MTRTWTSVGKDIVPESRHTSVAAMLDSMIWQEAVKGLTLGAMPGGGIMESIHELRIPKVSHVAVSHELAPLGLYGIRGHYTDGYANIYIADHGDELVCIASDFYPANKG